MNNLNQQAWNDYIEYRKEYKMRKLKPMSEKRLQAWLIEQGDCDHQAKIVDVTLRNGWTGLFELKEVKKQTNNFNDKTDWIGIGKGKGILPRVGETTEQYNARVRNTR